MTLAQGELTSGWYWVVALGERSDQPTLAFWDQRRNAWVVPDPELLICETMADMDVVGPGMVAVGPLEAPAVAEYGGRGLPRDRPKRRRPA